LAIVKRRTYLMFPPTPDALSYDVTTAAGSGRRCAWSTGAWNASDLVERVAAAGYQPVPVDLSELCGGVKRCVAELRP
jgi:hypothetical protein